MSRYWLATIFALGLTFLCNSSHAAASSIRLQPAIVRGTLESGEKQKGYIDVINPDSSKIVVSFSVQAFRQKDDSGAVEFYEDAQLSRGLLLDLNEVELGGHEALRLYYQADAALLPAGDVLAAIFATVKPAQDAPAAQAVRVGTLLVLQNTKTPKRQIVVTELSASLLQFGTSLQADFALRNDTPPVSGFFPQISVSTAPYGQQVVDGPLVTSGRQRAISYVKPGNYLGPVKITVSVEGAQKSRWVFAITGFWRWLFPLLVSIVVVAIAVWRIRARRRPLVKKRLR